MTDSAELRAELASLARSLSAHLELMRGAGATGLPPSALSPPREGLEAGAARAAEPPIASAAPFAPPDPEEVPRGELPRMARRPAAAPQPSVSTLVPTFTVPAGREAKLVRLTALAGEVAACTACKLHETRTQTVFARGNPQAELCFVGEGPGADEDAQGEPFVGKAGQLLDRMIVAMGLSRDEVYVCNIVKCRPPDNRKPDPAEMAACSPWLAEQLALLEPKIIVALGATAVEGLLGPIGGITRVRGQWKLYRQRVRVMPTFHPAYLLRNPPAKADVWKDLQEVVKQLGRTLPTRA